MLECLNMFSFVIFFRGETSDATSTVSVSPTFSIDFQDSTSTAISSAAIGDTVQIVLSLPTAEASRCHCVTGHVVNSKTTCVIRTFCFVLKSLDLFRFTLFSKVEFSQNPLRGTTQISPWTLPVVQLQHGWDSRDYGLQFACIECMHLK